jgi:hypothetical protein
MNDGRAAFYAPLFLRGVRGDLKYPPELTINNPFSGET